MINWIMISMIATGVIAGSEYKLRRSIKVGEFVCFQPLWSYRFLNFFTVIVCLFFLESARISLAAPTTQHVWFLIASVVLAVLALALQSTRELNFANMESDRLKRSRTI